MICTKCGKTIDGSHIACPNCGEIINYSNCSNYGINWNRPVTEVVEESTTQENNLEENTQVTTDTSESEENPLEIFSEAVSEIIEDFIDEETTDPEPVAEESVIEDIDIMEDFIPEDDSSSESNNFTAIVGGCAKEFKSTICELFSDYIEEKNGRANNMTYCLIKCSSIVLLPLIVILMCNLADDAELPEVKDNNIKTEVDLSNYGPFDSNYYSTFDDIKYYSFRGIVFNSEGDIDYSCYDEYDDGDSVYIGDDRSYAVSLNDDDSGEKELIWHNSGTDNTVTEDTLTAVYVCDYGLYYKTQDNSVYYYDKYNNTSELVVEDALNFVANDFWNYVYLQENPDGEYILTRKKRDADEETTIYRGGYVTPLSVDDTGKTIYMEDGSTHQIMIYDDEQIKYLDLYNNETNQIVFDDGGSEMLMAGQGTISYFDSLRNTPMKVASYDNEDVTVSWADNKFTCTYMTGGYLKRSEVICGEVKDSDIESSKSVNQFVVTDDNDVWYLTDDGTLYLYTNGNSEEKASELQGATIVFDESSNALFILDGYGLYKIDEFDDEPELVQANVMYIYKDKDTSDNSTFAYATIDEPDCMYLSIDNDFIKVEK